MMNILLPTTVQTCAFNCVAPAAGGRLEETTKGFDRDDHFCQQKTCRLVSGGWNRDEAEGM